MIITFAISETTNLEYWILFQTFTFISTFGPTVTRDVMMFRLYQLLSFSILLFGFSLAIPIDRDLLLSETSGDNRSYDIKRSLCNTLGSLQGGSSGLVMGIQRIEIRSGCITPKYHYVHLSDSIPPNDSQVHKLHFSAFLSLRPLHR
ncbi:unnamed protein product [Somion occarium]|uniref:Uncharacterized protein n=1 Tax=Somion occarium TaxID=3059160 RepID=A0ABP1DVK0_9APHY